MTAVTEQRKLSASGGQQELPAELAVYAQVIMDAARDPQVDVEKLKQLMDMQARVLDRRAEMDFNGAMARAQGEMKKVSANATNPQTRSKYATYDQLDDALRPIYTKHGFALSFDTGQGADPTPVPAQHVRVWLYLSHVSGYTRLYHVDMPNDGKGPKGGEVMSATHATGAGMSYGMRYLVKFAFNVAVGEEDKDGNTVYPSITEKQVADLKALAEETKTDIKKFCEYFKIDKIESLPASLYGSAVKAFEKKRRSG